MTDCSPELTTTVLISSAAALQADGGDGESVIEDLLRCATTSEHADWICSTYETFFRLFREGATMPPLAEMAPA